MLASPYYMQVAVDQALPALDRDLLTVLALGFGLFTLVNVGATLLRSFVLLSAGTSLSFGIASNIARKLFRLPVSWFEKRHVGDVLSRFQSIQPIQDALTKGAIAASVDGVLAVLTLVIMFFYSVKLALVAIVAFFHLPACPPRLLFFGTRCSRGRDSGGVERAIDDDRVAPWDYHTTPLQPGGGTSRIVADQA